ncbi:MAG: opacity protein-like surface antigen [Candidatus Krumholzibacteriia bacterium]|jgi:opacity protein-like surface antigen
MKTKLAIAVTLLVVLSASIAGANEVTAEDVVNNYIEALGGAEALTKYESRHMTGTFGQSGMTGELHVYSTSAQNYRMRLELTGVGEFEEGVFEGNGWTYDTMSGPQIMTGIHLESSLVRNRYNVELGYFELYDGVIYEGEVEYDGVLCNKLRLEGSWGSTSEYFEIETGLMRGGEGELPVAGGMLVNFKTTVVEYAEFDGRLYQSKTVQESPMGIQEIKITQVTHGQDDVEQVQPPTAVKPLLP